MTSEPVNEYTGLAAERFLESLNTPRRRPPTALTMVEGYVWCTKYEDVHSDTLNPHGYIEDGRQDYCLPEQHHRLYRSGPV